MKSESAQNHKTVTTSDLRRRLLKSLFAGFFFFLVVVFTFVSVRRDNQQEDGLPALLRQGVRTNARVGRALFSDKRLSPSRPRPGSGRAPRINGDLGLDGAIDDATYTIVVESGDRVLTLKPAEFQNLPKTDVSTEFKCVEGWSEIVQYAGVKFSDFLDAYKVGRRPDGSFYKYVGLETPDGGYYVSLDMPSMLHPQSVLAYEMNDRPLSLLNGYPLRLIIPIKYGIKSLKRIGRIFFSDQRPPDYWAENGYDWFAGL